MTITLAVVLALAGAATIITLLVWRFGRRAIQAGRDQERADNAEHTLDAVARARDARRTADARHAAGGLPDDDPYLRD